MKKIIIKYLNDSISDDELDRLKVWIQKPKNEQKFKEYVRINHELNGLNTKINTDKSFQHVLEQLHDTKGSSAGRLLNVLKYAAVFIGISLIGYGVYKGGTQNVYLPDVPQIVLQLEDGTTQIVEEGQSMVINNAAGQRVTQLNQQQLIYSSSDSAMTELRYNTLKVPYGKTFGLVLSDGTKVMLNAGSELKYPVHFIESENQRTVYLNGEAYFEVAKNEAHPFIVETHDMDIEVLGTTFNITSYTDDDKSYAVLVEGQVAAHNKLQAQSPLLMSPNQKVFFGQDELEIKAVSVDKYIAWVQGQLIFVDDSFAVIKNKLERKYNVTIKNNYKELNDVNITGTFKDESFDQVLKTFQTYIEFDYTIKNGVVTITEPK
ncbi:FecR family protein [Gelidibacter maritimus]|uniref:FecR family protein n=1 Tax=Gelidibacter maritimus TaxID=2761487 RepID=A0A7W2R2Q1_9FLAO|nr:FecR family protein [Gelidibacter maritimus]MBA6152051.1 FecR family protein [Gelidibacter maritimus]